MTKPTKEQLQELEDLTTKACLGNAPLLRRSDGDVLEALLDDYRARGEVLQLIAKTATYAGGITAARQAREALVGAGDEQ